MSHTAFKIARSNLLTKFSYVLACNVQYIKYMGKRYLITEVELSVFVQSCVTYLIDQKGHKESKDVLRVMLEIKSKQRYLELLRYATSEGMLDMCWLGYGRKYVGIKGSSKFKAFKRYYTKTAQVDFSVLNNDKGELNERQAAMKERMKLRRL